MKRNNKSWIRQLSESYIRQTLNESNLHQIIDDRHAEYAPEDKGRIKRILDDHAAKHGPFGSMDDAIDHLLMHHSNYIPTTDEGRMLTHSGWASVLAGEGAKTFPSNDSPSDTYGD